MRTDFTAEEVLEMVPNLMKKEIRMAGGGYVVVYLTKYKAGGTPVIRLTDDYERYKNVTEDGNYIFPWLEAVETLDKIEER